MRRQPAGTSLAGNGQRALETEPGAWRQRWCDGPLAAARAVGDVMRRLVERRPPELVAAGVARHPQMPHTPAPLTFVLRRGAQARLPADLRHPGPQPVAERAAMRLVIEHRYRHPMVMPHRAIFSPAGDVRAMTAARS
jgi:hypothetical protein